jgi:acetyl esterase/lipase
MTFRYLAVLAGLLMGAFMGEGTSRAVEDISWPKQTFVYKTVGPTKIEADVYRRNGTEKRPAVVWIHGGALIMGNRNGIEKNVVELCRERNYVLISIDYRLAPEVKLPAIIEDLKDAFRWIHTEGPAKLHLDPAKIVASGGSAGGYLTMMTGICVEPRPTALVAYWGYGDVDGPWYVEPSEFYRKSPLVAKDDAYRAVGGAVQTSGDGRQRGAFYLYCRQNGLWTREITGFDPKLEREKLDPYCPVRNVTPQYPPILMVHGTADTDVPYQESADMDAALEKQGVPHELVTVEGGGHGLGDKTNPAVIDAHARARAFFRKYLD